MSVTIDSPSPYTANCSMSHTDENCSTTTIASDIFFRTTDVPSNSTIGPSYELHLTRLIVQSYLVPIVVVCGLIGNLFNVIVLVNPKMRTSTNVYLFSLAICDSMYLLFCLTLSFLHCSDSTLDINALNYIPFGRVFSDLFGNTSVWLTVCFTMERCIAVRRPMRGKRWCTVKKAKTAVYIIFICCLVNTFPEFFETRVTSIQRDNVTTYSCHTTEFASTSGYQFGYYWWFVALFTFLPLVLLSVFNSLLIRTVWEASRRREMMSHARLTGDSLKHNREQQRVTVMLISVVVIFLLCQTPQALLLIYRSYVNAKSLPYSADLVKIAGNICNFLVQINASVNFFLYSYFSSKFRRTFRQVICGCHKRWRRKTKYNMSVSSNRRSSSNFTTTTLTTSSCPPTTITSDRFGRT